MGLRDFTLFDIVERNARLHPNRLAFALGEERVTHATYRASADRLAAGLARAGVRPGDRVSVASQNNLEFVDLYGTSADRVRMNVSVGVLIALLHGAHPADVQQKDVDAAMSFSFSIADRFVSELTRRPLVKDPI